jgi:hypothetical protein
LVAGGGWGRKACQPTGNILGKLINWIKIHFIFNKLTGLNGIKLWLYLLLANKEP